MASWSRLLVPIGRSWCIFVLVFAAVLLRWREQSQAVELRRSISDNKAVLSFLSSFLVLLYERDTGQWWSVRGKLPWRKMCRTPPAASSSNKRLLLQIDELLSHLLRSAGHGGEGEVKGRHQLVRSGGEKGCLACPGKISADPAAISKLWRRLAMAIHGQEGGLAVLEHRGVSSFFFLQLGRIFSCLGVALDVAVDPSGLVPGVGGGGGTWRLLSGGEALGLDCVFASFLRVCSVKVQGPVVISFSFGVLAVICHRRVC